MNPHAQALGKLGGKANTPAQNAARRENGKLGGRTKKQKRRKPNGKVSHPPPERKRKMENEQSKPQQHPPAPSLTWESYALAWKASLEEERAYTLAMLERIGSALLKGDDASALAIVQRRLTANDQAHLRVGERKL